MIINKELLLACEVCPEALLCFTQEFGTASPTLEAVLTWIPTIPDIRKAELKGWCDWVNHIQDTKPQFYTSQGIKLMSTENFQLFNDLTGEYEFFNTIEASFIRKELLQAEYIALHSELFSIRQELLTPGGASVWEALDGDKV